MWPLIWNGWVLLYLCGHKSSPDDNRFHVVARLCFALHYLRENWSLLTSILVIIDNTVDESISYLCPLEEDVLSLLVVAELHGFIRNWNLRFVINIPSFFSSTSYIFIVISKHAIFHPPVTFVTGIDSPVSIDSLATALPDTKTASHSTMYPDLNKHKI